jgi:hypothetical protein
MLCRTLILEMMTAPARLAMVPPGPVNFAISRKLLSVLYSMLKTGAAYYTNQ